MYRDKLSDCKLYLLITEEFCRGRAAAEIARRAIAGGVDMVQMREKEKSRGEILVEGKELLAVCREGGVPFIVNDDPCLARDIGADGVHLGQDDMRQFSVEDARGILGKDSIVGVSASSIDQLKEAEKLDIDYTGFGPVFRTKIKEGSAKEGEIRKVLDIARKPVFFIGGIDSSNINKLIAQGAKHFAVIRAICEAEDVESATRQLSQR